MGTFAQEKSAKEIKGDKFFFIYAYDNAISKYSRTKDLTVSGQRNLASSYRLMKQNEKSEETYAKMIEGANGLVPSRRGRTRQDREKRGSPGEHCAGRTME